MDWEWTQREQYISALNAGYHTCIQSHGSQYCANQYQAGMSQANLNYSIGVSSAKASLAAAMAAATSACEGCMLNCCIPEEGH